MVNGSIEVSRVFLAADERESAPLIRGRERHGRRQIIEERTPIITAIDRFAALIEKLPCA